MPYKEPTPEELAASRPLRIAKQRLEKQERYLALLRLAKRTREDNGQPGEALQSIIAQGEDELSALSASLGGPIVARKRPTVQTTETCTVFVDECGAHTLTAKDKFGAFCLAAVIIRDSDYKDVDALWKGWKATHLRSTESRVHEPDIRQNTGSFYCGGDVEKRIAAISDLPNIIARLAFSGVVCVINRPAYVEQFGTVSLDENLPHHPYLMTLHFVAERVAMSLQTHYEGAKARLVFESRGPKEDADIQYEFARLFIDGTSYVAAKYFRKQFLPGITFLGKSDNSTGLQIADLMARPCAEKILDPSSTPERWPAFRDKLCLGEQTGHSVLGLKILPWQDAYEGIWKS